MALSIRLTSLSPRSSVARNPLGEGNQRQINLRRTEQGEGKEKRAGVGITAPAILITMITAWK